LGSKTLSGNRESTERKRDLVRGANVYVKTSPGPYTREGNLTANASGQTGCSRDLKTELRAKDKKDISKWESKNRDQERMAKLRNHVTPSLNSRTDGECFYQLLIRCLDNRRKK